MNRVDDAYSPEAYFTERCHLNGSKVSLQTNDPERMAKLNAQVPPLIT